MKKKHWTCNFYILLSWLTTTLTYKPVGVMHLTGCFSYRAPLTLLIPPSPPLTLSFLYEMEIHRNYEAKVLIRKIYKCCKYLVNDRYKGFFFSLAGFIRFNSILVCLPLNNGSIGVWLTYLLKSILCILSSGIARKVCIGEGGFHHSMGGASNMNSLYNYIYLFTPVFSSGGFWRGEGLTDLWRVHQAPLAMSLVFIQYYSIIQ